MNYLINHKKENKKLEIWTSADYEMVEYTARINKKTFDNIENELTRFGYQVKEPKKIKTTRTINI